MSKKIGTRKPLSTRRRDLLAASRRGTPRPLLGEDYRLGEGRAGVRPVRGAQADWHAPADRDLVPAVRRARERMAGVARVVPGFRSNNYSRRHFDDVLKAAKLDDQGYTPRDLRARFASHLVSVGRPLAEVGDL